MKTRMSNLVISGLVIIVVVLIFYYMSCESKAMGLEHISKEFEEKIRTVSWLLLFLRQNLNSNDLS